MRGQDDRVAVVVELADERPQALPQPDVDAGGRLVEHDHRRLVHQRLADQHPPLHPARQRAHVGVGLGREVEVVQDFVDPRAVVADAEIPGLDLERLARREERVEHQLLRHDAEQAPRVAVVGDDVVAEDARACRVSARVSPARIEISVVLPAPLGPSSPKNSPSSTARSTPASACTGPKRRATLTASTAAGIGYGCGSIGRSGNANPDRRCATARPAGSAAEHLLDAVERQRASTARQARRRTPAPRPSAPRGA